MTQTDPTVLLADAMGSVTADASIVAILSPQSRIMTVTVQTAINTVVGDAAASLMASLAPDILTMVGETATASLATVGEMIPFVGQVVAGIMLVVDDINGKEAAKKAAKEAAVQQCQQEEAQAAPVGTGPDVMPTDIFSLYDSQDVAELGLKYSSAGDRAERPTLGNTLRWLTEDSGPHRKGLLAMYPAIAKNENLARMFGLERDTAFRGDIPAGRRAMFRKLRLAMESQRKHLPRGSTDGGASLWPIYLDLLKDEYAAGHITDGSATFLLGHYLANSKTGAVIPQPLACVGTAPARARMIRRLVTDWEETLNPWYSSGASKQKELEEKASEIAADVARSRTAYRGWAVKKSRFVLPSQDEMKRKSSSGRIKRITIGGIAVFVIGKLVGFW